MEMDEMNKIVNNISTIARLTIETKVTIQNSPNRKDYADYEKQLNKIFKIINYES